METLRIDGYIGRDDGMAMLFGGAPNVSLKFVTDFLDNLPDGTTELKVEINSGGGEVNEGFAIHDRLASSGLTIHTEVLGLCGSIATVIALSAKPENRSMHENSEYFIHNPFWQPMAPDAMEADDLQRLAEDLRSSEERIVNFYKDKTGLSTKELERMMDQAKSISAKDAKKFGFISKIITEAANERKYRIAAYVNPTKKTTSNMGFTPAQKEYLNEQFNNWTVKFNQKFPTTFKNQKLELESGGTVVTEGEGELVGQKVWVADDAGNKTDTPAADGDHKLKDGKTIVVNDGVITEVKEATPAADETQNLKATIAELEGKLAEANKTNTELQVKQSEQEKNIVAMKKEVEDFRGMVLGADVPPTVQHFPGAPVKKNENQEWLELKRKNKAQQNKK